MGYHKVDIMNKKHIEKRKLVSLKVFSRGDVVKSDVSAKVNNKKITLTENIIS